MSAAPNIEALLQQLKNLPSGTPFEQAIASLTPPAAPAILEARRRCALVRAFDSEVYAELTRDFADAPSLQEFTAERCVIRLATNRWSLDEATRAPLLKEWQSTKSTEWKKWNARLAQFFLARNQIDDRLDALYHMAGCPNPDEGLEHFERWYNEADQRFDLAQCNALLEILRIQEGSRGSKLTRAWHDYRQYYQARQISADDYFKTGAYFERSGPLKEFGKVLAPGAPEWVFHIHATGGAGKTMFLRWLASRMFVPKRIPYARIDFDDFTLGSALEFPNRIFARIIDQLAAQVPGSGLTALREKLQRELESPGWNTSVPEEIGRQLLGANLQTNLVVMLDTLEDVTRTGKDWMESCMQSLRRLHELHPRFVVVLSGRYDISKLTNALRPGEFINYELTRFTPEEADGYLSKRGIPQGDVRDAIVERAGEGAGSDEDEVAGRNPFTLAMLAELTLNGSVMTADAVRKLPRVDIAYLIQRVIMRIPSQPLRWTVRYGVVARHLNLGFIDAVLLPPLKEALRGKAVDDPNENLKEKLGDRLFEQLLGKSGSESGKFWEPDPALAETITAADIWSQLKTYTRERGWISLVGSEAEGTETLRFHPDVVEPTRDLLRGQTIYQDLHRRAAEFFLVKSGLDEATQPWKSRNVALRNAIEAVFHRFQLDGPQARDFWIETLSSLETRYSPSTAVELAEEITGSAYARLKQIPLEPVMNPPLLREAHLVAADLMLQVMGLNTHKPGTWSEFKQHVDDAWSISARFAMQPPPLYLVVISNVNPSEKPAAIAQLEEVERQTDSVRERVFLTVERAQLYDVEHSREAAAAYETALELLPNAERTGIKDIGILFKLVTRYRQTGNHTKVLDTLMRGRKAAAVSRDPLSIEFMEKETLTYALEAGDLILARECLDSLRSKRQPDRPDLELVPLEVTLALDEGNLRRAIQLATDTQVNALVADSDLLRAGLLEVRGHAFGRVFDSFTAQNCWEEASACYDRAAWPDAAARCSLHSARLAGRECGSVSDSVAIADGAMQLRGTIDPDNLLGLQLLRAYTNYRRKLAPQENAALIAELRKRRSDWSPLNTARLAVFELVFGFTRDAEHLAAALDAIEALQPQSRRARILDWAEFSEVALRVPQDIEQRIDALFELNVPHENAPAEDDIARAHLLRILGRTEKAREFLRRRPMSRDPDAALYWRWRMQTVLLSLDQPTEFRSVLTAAHERYKNFLPLAPDKAWMQSIEVESALEAVRAGDSKAAHEIASRGMPFHNLNSQGDQTRWVARIEQVRHYALDGEPWGSHAQETSDFFQRSLDRVRAEKELAALPKSLRSGPSKVVPSPVIAGPRAQPPPSASPSPAGTAESGMEAHVEIGPAAYLPAPLARASGSNEAAIDSIMGNWHELAESMSSLLGDGRPPRLDAFSYEIASQLVGLPWEFASFLDQCRTFWRTQKYARTPTDRGPDREQRVLLLRPREGSDDVSLESASGETLESLYQARGISELQVLYDPRPEDLQEMLHKFRPTLLHFNTVMRETNGGLYLDFESTESRADELGARRGPLRKANAQRATASQRRELVWTTTRLSRALQGADVLPTLVLDIAAARNLAETVRMLLLRNQFAHQLFQIAPLRSLLAAGLADEHERLDLTRAMVETLIDEGPTAALRALRTAPLGDHSFARPNAGPDATLELSSVIPRRGAAIWAHPNFRETRLS